MMPIAPLRRAAASRAPHMARAARMSTSAHRRAATDGLHEAQAEPMLGQSQEEAPKHSFPLRTEIAASRHYRGVLLASSTSVLLTRADKVQGPLRDLAVRMVEQQERKLHPADAAPSGTNVNLSDDQIDRMVTVIVEAAAQHIGSTSRGHAATPQAAGKNTPAQAEVETQTGAEPAQPKRRPRRQPNWLFESQFAAILSMPLSQLILGVERDTMEPLASLAKEGKEASEQQRP